MPRLGDRSFQPHPHMLICRHDDSNHVLAFTSGQHADFEPVHCAAKYEKFVYSNMFGFSVPRGDFGLQQGAFDSMLALSEGDNIFRVRRKCEEYKVTEREVYSRWKPWHDVEVETWLIPVMPWHVRIHRINTRRPLETAECGFAIGREKDLTISGSDSIILEPGGIAAQYPWGISRIVNLKGDRSPELINAEPNTNIMVPRTVIPALKGALEPGVHIIACAVLGEAPDGSGRFSREEPPQLELDNNILRIIKTDYKGPMEVFRLHI